MDDRMRQYWSRNLRYMAMLLTVWALAGYVFSIFLVEPLNAFQLGGFPLGFWFAQQGSIYIFVCLIFAYYFLMQKLDKEFDVHE